MPQLWRFVQQWRFVLEVHPIDYLVSRPMDHPSILASWREQLAAIPLGDAADNLLRGRLTTALPDSDVRSFFAAASRLQTCAVPAPLGSDFVTLKPELLPFTKQKKVYEVSVRVFP